MLGLSYFYSERVFTSDDFEGSTTTAGPALSAGYESQRWSASVMLGTARFDSEYSSISSGLSVRLDIEADVYAFKTYYSSVRTLIRGYYFDGDGETGPDDTFVQINFADLQFGLYLTSELSPLTFYGGPIWSFIRGTFEPREYDAIDLRERHWIGLGGGIKYTPGQWNSWRFSAEMQYLDYFAITFGVTYRT